jgi:hypothetical protein
MIDNASCVDLDRVRCGQLPEALIAEDTDVLIDLCKRWDSLPGYSRKIIIRKAGGPHIESCIIALSMKHLTELADRVNGMRRLSNEQIRQVKDLLRSGGY